jgi:membrane protein DedA with SNARE-associated domain
MALEDVLKRWGLFAVFAGAATEGDVTMLLAGVLAHLGLIDLASAIVVGTLGGYGTDLFAYAIGRLRSDKIRAGQLYRRLGPTVERLGGIFGVWQVVIARFIYGTNLATMFFSGVRALSLSLFLPLAFAGCAIWASVLAILGYVMSRSATAVIGEVQRGERWFLVALVACAGVSVTLRFLLRRRRSNAHDPKA